MKLNDDFSNYHEYVQWLDAEYTRVMAFKENETYASNLITRLEKLEQEHPALKERAIFSPEKDIAKKTYLLCLQIKELINEKR